MLRLLGRRAVSASQELTSVHQWRIRTDSKPDPFRIFRGLLQKGFCVGVLPDGVDRKSEAFSSNSIAMEGILSELRSHITKVTNQPFYCLQKMMICISVPRWSFVGISWRWRGGGEEEQK